MADLTSTAHLPQPKSTNESETELPSLTSTIELCLQHFNLSQFLQTLLISLAWFFDAQQTFITIFTDAATHGGASSSSIISEWHLNPNDAIHTSLPSSSFFAGCLAGGIALSTLADTTLGRKNMLFYSCLSMSLSSLASSFSPNLWVYSCLKFLSGFGRSTIATSSLVLATELAGKKWRGKVAVMGFLCFFFGFLSLPAIAYLNRNSSWRHLYLYTSIPSIFYSVLLKFLVHESPRWLFVQGRKEEAVKTLRSITSLSQSALTLAVSKISDNEESSGNNSMDLFSELKVLMQKKWALRRILTVMAMGFGIGLVYFGMPLGLGTLSFNLYLSVTLNALSELPSSILVFILIDKFNRRTSLWIFTFISAVFSVASVVKIGKTWAGLRIGLELVSFFNACSASDIYLLYATELFPTCVRNSALAMARQAVVLGGAVSPVLVAAGRRNKFWCYGVFGLVIALSGVFVVFLPKTRGRALCDTMDEEEEKEKGQH